MTETSTFQQAIEVVEALSLDDQIVLLNLLQRRLQQRRRSQILQEVEDVRRDYAEGNVQYGSVADFLSELDA
ncbi:hypothetical protein H6F43_08625 [Leptolyngbya sp. FACHB-36]|uniref:hypothetical protein n=1 Tax=Leptolyngbya sp. FACHB-36 TaxID=2692808 RepID=UPI0016806A2A|nr:hypothetical protein [Leptolyngbya sp. FACHB-36]MBD2020249.1 hypothetical protein [Leptolyngbya sp. FACHB-36]